MSSVAPLTDNPFAVLSAVAAPAILTNACSVLGTANRIARVVDRTRVVTAAQASLVEGDADHRRCFRELEHLAIRASLPMKALGTLYASLGAFAAPAFAAAAGSALASYDLQSAFCVAAVLGFGVGSFRVMGLAWGCVLMVRETREAIQSMEEARQGPL